MNKNELSLQVVHFTPLKDRFEYLNSLATEELPINFITEQNLNLSAYSIFHTRNVMNLNPVRYGFNLGVNSRSLSNTRIRAIAEGVKLIALSTLIKKYKNTPIGSIPEFKKLPRSHVELSIMHLNAIYSGIQSTSNWILILEDDAIASKNWLSILSDVIASYSLKRNIYISLNSGAGLIRTSSDPKPDKHGIYRVRPISTRCTAAYLINRSLAIKIIEKFRKFGIQDWLPIDVQLQICLQKIKANTYWQDPPIFIQGSENNFYNSNLR